MRLLLALVFVVLLVMPTLAQDLNRILVADSTVSATLNSNVSAVSYVFDAAANTVASLSANSSGGAALALLLTDINGNTIVGAADRANTGSVTLNDIALANAGRYSLFIYLAPGSAPIDTAFDLTLSLADSNGTAAVEGQSAPAAAEPELILLGAGIEAQLTWDGAVDMNLEVRDPSGQSLHWDSRTTNNGGVFGFDANGLCQVISDDPVETAIWQPGYLSTGSYEVIVYYEQACDTFTGSVPFRVDVTVDGVLAGSIANTLAPVGQAQQNVYVARFEINGDGSANLTPGGSYPSASLTLLPSGLISSPTVPAAITRDVPVLGAISNEQPYLTYSFNGSANELVSIDMQAVGQNLDTLVQLVDPAGKVVNVNDDTVAGNTNSVIANARLLSSGTYTIIATRYAKELGGTEGQFQLTLTGPSADAPVEQSSLNLPQGDIEVTLSWSSNADLQLLVRDPVGESVFDDNPVSVSGGILQSAGNVNCIPAASGAPVSYIYWPTGQMRPGTYEVEVWYQDACSELPPPVDFTLLIEANGQLVANAIQFPQVGQRYVISFTIPPSGAALAGEGGFIDGGSSTLAYQEEAFNPPQIQDGISVTGTITPDNTFDVYQFSGAFGETVTISMAAATQTLDTNLYLIGPSETEIAANDDGDPLLLATGRKTDSLISGFLLPENGSYKIIATRFANQYGGTIGSYELTMRKS